MDLHVLLPLLMFVMLMAALLSGYPVAFALAGTSLVFAAIGAANGVFFWSDLGFVPSRIYGIISNVTLIAVPLFVFMGLTLDKSGVAEELLNAMSRILGRLRGSLAISVVLVGALLAASTGIVGATVVTMGVLSLPTMLERGYQKELALGTIAASGTLGQIIPPSIILVLLGDLMNVDVGDLFVGAIIPGLLLVTLYLVYIVVQVYRRPELAPRVERRIERSDWLALIHAVIPPLVLMLLVLGSIMAGAASPTEAAACGAVGALAVAGLRRRLNRAVLWDIMKRTAMITSMVFIILAGAQFFGVVFRGLRGEDMIISTVADLALHPGIVLAGLMCLLFVLGCFLDFIEICFIAIPVIYPVLVKLGYDPLWVAIMIAVNLQTSFLTPPFGFALFYLKGVAPPGVTTAHLYRGIAPFVILQLLALGLVAAFPALVTWLPRLP